MREFIKMLFFRGVFLFWLVCLILFIINLIEERITSLQSNLENIEIKKLKEQKQGLEFRIGYMEKYATELTKNYHDLLNRYYELMSSQICWKTVEQRLREDKIVSRKKKK